MNIPVIGVWDDHDYGQGNGDTTFEYKELAKAAFLNFLDDNTTDRWMAGRGIYQDYLIVQDGITLHIILLDVRYDYSDSDRLGDA